MAKHRIKKEMKKHENGKLVKIIEVKGFENRSFRDKWKLFQVLHPETFKITELVKNVS